MCLEMGEPLEARPGKRPKDDRTRHPQTAPPRKAENRLAMRSAISAIADANEYERGGNDQNECQIGNKGRPGKRCVLHIQGFGGKLQVAAYRQPGQPNAKHRKAEQHRSQNRQFEEELHDSF